MDSLPPTCFIKAKHIKLLFNCSSPGHQTRLVLPTADQSLDTGDNRKVFISPPKPEPHKSQLYIQTPLSRGRWAVFYYLHVSNPLCRASLTCSFEAIVTPRVTHILRASEALKAYWSWSTPLKRLTWNTPAMVWFSAGKTGKNIELQFKEVFAFRKRIIVYLWCHFWQNSDHTWHRWLTALMWCKAKSSSWLERWRDGDLRTLCPRQPKAEG